MSVRFYNYWIAAYASLVVTLAPGQMMNNTNFTFNYYDYSNIAWFLAFVFKATKWSSGS